MYSTTLDVDVVTAVKLSPDEVYVVAFMNDASYRRQFYMAIISAVNGSLLKGVKDSYGKEAEVHTQSLYFDPST